MLKARVRDGVLGRVFKTHVPDVDSSYIFEAPGPYIAANHVLTARVPDGVLG